MTLDGLHAALQHTAAGCNRSVGCLSWGTKDLIIYGSHRTVVVYDTQVRTRQELVKIGKCCSVNRYTFNHIHLILVHIYYNVDEESNSDASGTQRPGDLCEVGTDGANIRDKG